MAYPTYTAADLAEFSGRAVETYTSYATQATTQATLLFKMATCLADFPTDPDEAQLAKFAILSIADSFVLIQPYQLTKASPFTSETIGSYSYSKAKAVTVSVANGSQTGDMWFDLAVSKLSVCDEFDGVPTGGGVEVFEYDGIFTTGHIPDNVRLLGPKDLDRFSLYPFAPLSPLMDPDAGGGGGGGEIIWDDPELPSVPSDWIEDPENPGFFFAP
jgi:hypothetical protein